nr:hypothetical protein [Deltaproteobacteria bacterium]
APTKLRRLAAIGTSIVPGIVLRGAGSYVIGEKPAARRLAITGGIGLGAMLVGGLVVGVSGGSPYTVVPGVPVLLVGAGLYVPTWFADIWVAAGGSRVTPERRAPAPWSVEVGTTYLRDPFRKRALIRTAATYELDKIGLGASSLVDADGASKTGDAEVRWRLRGSAASGAAIDYGSKLLVRAGYRIHRDDEDDVTLQTLEAELLGRLDLLYIHRAFDGNFIEISTGLGVELATYARDAHDTGSLLLGRFAWGAYLGASELTVFYDHRRDSLAGGFPAWRASGFVGSFGASTLLRVGGPFTLHAELEIGNAWVSTLALRYQGGPP